MHVACTTFHCVSLQETNCLALRYNITHWATIHKTKAGTNHAQARLGFQYTTFHHIVFQYWQYCTVRYHTVQYNTAQHNTIDVSASCFGKCLCMFKNLPSPPVPTSKNYCFWLLHAIAACFACWNWTSSANAQKHCLSTLMHHHRVTKKCLKQSPRPNVMHERHPKTRLGNLQAIASPGRLHFPLWNTRA